MDTPGSALIGVGAIGIGSLLLYGAYKNVPVFGPSGVFTQAVTTGKIVAPATSPNSPAKPGGVAGAVQSAQNNPYIHVWEWVMKNLIGKGIT